MVRNLFFNTPVRRKFLKTAMTEASYVTDLLEHMALSRPEISFKYVLNGQTKFYTNGDGDLKAIIYRIFGRDIANEMIAFHAADETIVMDGFLGRPTLNRANRNFENYFVNKRYIKSKIISKAIEEGYQSYMMQHRYPFCVVHITVPTESVDVNVHPTKMEVRFSNQNSVYKSITENIADFLSRQEMIPDATLGPDKKLRKKDKNTEKIEAPEPFEKERRFADQTADTVPNILKEDARYHYAYGSSYDHSGLANEKERMNESLQNSKTLYQHSDTKQNESQKTLNTVETDNFFVDSREKAVCSESAEESRPAKQNPVFNKILGTPSKETEPRNLGIIKSRDQIIVEKPEQLNFFDEKILTKEAKQEYRIVGQVFDTYWIIEYRDKMLMIDQHAAHEKVKYEQILSKVDNNETYTQTLTPPVVISVTPKEAAIISGYEQYFQELGFEIEDFGINAFAIRGVPIDLFGYNIKELFEEILTQMVDNPVRGVPQIIREKIASMACKAAVKGNHSLTYEEADQLIEQLLELDNPYNCPHGRPTIISMSKYEIEKKFKRIV